MDYLEVITDLHKWLEKYQITQKSVTANVEKGRLKFLFLHPTEGYVEVIQDFPDSEFFQSHGVGFRIKERNGKKVNIDVYDYGGIYDPIEKRVKGEHYSTSHYALLSAILFNDTRNDEYLDCARMALEFHLNTYNEEYHFSSWDYHWDFQNYSLLESFFLLKDYLSDNEIKRWIKYFRYWKTNAHNVTNWNAMRAFAYLLRYRLLKSKMDIFKFWHNLQIVKKSQLRDGCFQDDVKSRPIQYHIFTAALLHRIYMIKPSDEVRRRFLSSIDFFINFIDEDGDFNYYGRGQEQIFGYGSAIYALEAAKIIDKTNNSKYQYYIEKIWSYLLRYRKKDGHYPLVLNRRPDNEKYGWYDYHHLTVYNTFLAVWLGLAHLLKAKRVTGKKYPCRKITFYKPSQIVIVNNDEFFLVVSGGICDYLSEAGLTFQHLFFRGIGWIFSCPGGPSVERFGKINIVENVDKNFLSPIAKDSNGKWINPSGKRGKILEANKDHIVVSLDYGPFIIRRTVMLNKKSIIVNDIIFYKRLFFFEEFRFFNFPIVLDKFDIRLWNNRINIIERESGKRLLITVFKGIYNKLEPLEMIKTARGLAQVIAGRETQVFVRRSEKREVEFRIERDA